MKDFNIAKYLKEHSLGSHGILGKYVDLQALKEEETNLGQQKAMKEPYEGPENPIDGLGGKLNRHMDVSMNEMNGDMENSWMKDVDGTEAYTVGDWKCYYDYPGVLVWSYKDMPFDKIAIYATPNYDGDDTTPIQIDVNGENEDMMALNQGIFADFNEYAAAMKPYLNRIENDNPKPKSTYVTDDSEDDKGFIVPEDDARVEEAEEIDMNEYDQLLGAIENLLRQGESAQNILRVVKDTLGMNEGMEDDSFIQAQRDAASGFESEDQNRMMGLIDTILIPQLPKIKKAVDLARQRGLSDMAVLKMLATNSLTRGTIKNLIDDGFDPQDIVDFFATDFSMQEDDINLADLDTEDVGA
jgi:hypothetical protein